MRTETIYEGVGQPSRERSIWTSRAAGRSLAESISSMQPHGTRKHRPEKGQAERILVRSRAAPEAHRAWLVDNVRLLQTSAKQAFEFTGGLREFPVASGPFGATPRLNLIARGYLEHTRRRFSEETCAAFLDGFQEVMALQMGEIWALKPMLQAAILTQVEVGPADHWPDLINSLRHIGETAWRDLFESVSLVERVLGADPAGAYSRMDADSRERYRGVIAGLARHSHGSERAVAEAAIELAHQAFPVREDSRAAVRRSHVGYYLVDAGLPILRRRIQYHRPWHDHVREYALRYPTSFYLVGIELITFITVAALLSGLGSFTPRLIGMLLLLLPATQTAVDFMNHLAAFLVRPRVLPRLDLSEGVPEDCATMVAVPSLLLNEAQVRDLVLDLEIRFLANRDPNIYFALLTDAPDSDSPEEPGELVALCRELIEGLNRRYPESPFFLFHRQRIYSASESRWMGWERKRGKLLDLNQLMRGGFDAFPTKVGRIEALPEIRYVITLDSDTQLPRDAAAKLIGAIAHPLNAAVVDPVSKTVREGYGILQPRIGISIHSASRTRMAALYSGETGFDIYTRSVSDVYQDLFADAIFTGKGIYEVDIMRAVLEQRFPDNALLSHDLIEGAYARVALLTDVELIDDYPSHFSAYNRRKHRWVRGDWQILRWTFSRVPNCVRNLVTNPISILSRWKIVDNLRRSLLDPAMLLLLLGSWFVLPGSPGYWTAAAVAVLFLPVYCDLLFALLRIPRSRRGFAAWVRDTAHTFVNGHVIGALSLTFLLHQALLSIDAIWRSILRVFVTKRKLLEWETAAQAEAADRRKSTVDVYLEWSPLISLILGVLVWRLHPASLRAAAPVLVLWMGSRAVSAWLNRAPRTLNRTLKQRDAQWLQAHAERQYRFFEDWSSPASNWLIPDSVAEDGAVAMRLSPTNLAMLLNARIAALHLGFLTLPDFVSQTRGTLDQVVFLPKYRGHLYNWYDIESLEPLEPVFVSTVDSGNLAAALWTLKQAALSLARESRAKCGVTPESAAALAEIAAMADLLVRDMDFRFLYHPRKKLLSVGYTVAAGRLEPSYYDLLASEARTAVFVAIAKGDIPQEAWFHLGRAHTEVRGERVLLSWTGTMFEYLMPALWMRHYPETITTQSTQAIVRIQQQHCSSKGVPWGISECACAGADGAEHAYAPFGIGSVSLKRQRADSLIVAPYAAFLALMVSPVPALKNLRHMEEYGWYGRYGFYEAAEYTAAGAQLVRIWMAHHEGMSLLSICNLLCDNPLQQYFHAEPHVMATELLLNERLPSTVVAEPQLEAPPCASVTAAA